MNAWLRARVLTGWPALLCGLLAVVLPTAARVAVGGSVAGCEFTPYVPFVLASAILLRWWQAGAVAVASVAVMGGLFEGSLFHPMSCFVPAAGIFLAASAMMIGIALVLKRLIFAKAHGVNDEPNGGVVFSLEKGEVWASWYGADAPVRLGTQSRVSEMMNDFLAQAELGKRLADK